MSTISLTIFWICIAYAVYHFLWAVWFRWRLPRQRFSIRPEFQPQTSVILSLRGKDPFVEDTIRNLLDQDYENYELRIIVDSETDPVWETLKPFEGHSRLHVSVLSDRLKTCSLKCSAIVQALAEVPAETEIIALVDADISPSRSWLQKMVSPLADRSIGVVTGNQWFSPRENRMGSIVRSLWNAAALVVTFLFKHTWAGSCAMRLSDIRESGLIDQWRTTIVDDGPIDGAMRKLRIKTVFVADLITVNREECDFGFSVQYNTRMLTWSRIYEWGFLATLAHMVYTISMILMALGLTGANLVAGNYVWALVLFGGVLSIQFLLLFAYLLTEDAIRQLDESIVEKVTPMTLIRAIKIWLFIPAALVAYSLSALRASFAKKIRWRNATYEIRNRFEVKLLDDQPFSSNSLPLDRQSSI